MRPATLIVLAVALVAILVAGIIQFVALAR